ncbi:HTH domain-containing protein [Chloroflexota bacterium]
MSISKAITEILRKTNKPLHIKEIAERILAEGLWKTSGKTPQATVSATLYSDIKKRGDKSLFVKVAPQVFALKEIITTNTKTDIVLPINQNKIESADIKSNSLSFTNSAQRVLEELGDSKPMHYREITAKAIEKGWLITGGKTPEATMYAQILTEIKRYQKRGKYPRFVQHGRGYVGLARWMSRGLAFQIEQHNQQVRKSLMNRLLSMTSVAFEELISQLLAEMGFEMVEVTKVSGDGGIDVRGTLVVSEVVRLKMAVQVKKWKPKTHVLAPVVQQVRGSLGTHEQGLIITTSDFSKGAIEEAVRSDAVPVALMNGEQLALLLMEYGIGVKRSAHNLFELDEDTAVEN